MTSPRRSETRVSCSERSQLRALPSGHRASPTCMSRLASSAMARHAPPGPSPQHPGCWLGWVGWKDSSGL
eukprot:7085291-Alexandrium_andersonii.AAC.1